MQAKSSRPAPSHRFQLPRPVEARMNAREARELCEPIVPAHLREKNATTETTAAGACFRKVTAILDGAKRPTR